MNYFLKWRYTSTCFYRNLRMIDIEEFHNKTDSMDLGAFQNLCMKHIDAAKRSLLHKWVFNVDLCVFGYFSFQPVLHDWCNKGHGMCYPVSGMMHIKEPLLLVGKSSPSPQLSSFWNSFQFYFFFFPSLFFLVPINSVLFYPCLLLNSILF